MGDSSDTTTIPCRNVGSIGFFVVLSGVAVSCGFMAVSSLGRHPRDYIHGVAGILGVVVGTIGGLANLVVVARTLQITRTEFVTPGVFRVRRVPIGTISRLYAILSVFQARFSQGSRSAYVETDDDGRIMITRITTSLSGGDAKDLLKGRIQFIDPNSNPPQVIKYFQDGMDPFDAALRRLDGEIEQRRANQGIPPPGTRSDTPPSRSSTSFAWWSPDGTCGLFSTKDATTSVPRGRGPGF
jgi:hypothetical protein